MPPPRNDDFRDFDEDPEFQLLQEIAAHLDADARPRTPYAIPVRHLYGPDLRELGRALGVRPASHRAVESALASAERVRVRLLAAPPAALFAAEALLAGGGQLEETDLAEIVGTYRGWKPAEAFAAAKALVRAGLAVVLPGTSRVYALIAPAAEHVARLVAGISVPPVRGEVKVTRPAAPATAQRDTIVLAALAAHRRLRTTRSGALDRGSLKSFVKGIGIELEVAEARLRAAADARLLERAGERLVPDVSALDRAAAGGIDLGAADDVDRLLEPAVGIGKWIAVEAVVRALVEQQAPFGRWPPSHRGFGAYWRQFRERAERRIAHTAGLDHGTDEGGVRVVRVAPASAAPPPGAARGDGHVTPSFDVIVGPAADPRLLPPIALGCQLQRIDRVLTFRITPDSIASGIACGLEPAAFGDALAAVGPHGLAPNVAAMVGDWSRRSRPLLLAEGVFAFGDPDRVDSLAAALAQWVVRRPLPGALELDPDVPEALLAEATSRAGLVLGAGAAGRLHSARAYHAHDSPRIGRRGVGPLLVVPEPDAALRAHAVDSSPPEVAVDLATADPAESFEQICTRLEHTAQNHAQGPLLHAAALRLRTALGALTDWARRLSPAARREAIEAIDEKPLGLLPVLLLTPKHQRRVLARSPSFAVLLEVAARHLLLPGHADLAAHRLALLASDALPADRTAGAFAAATATPPPGARAHPHPPALETRTTLARAIDGGGLTLRLTLHDGASIEFWPERIIRRGRTEALVGTDLERDENRVVPLDAIAAAALLEVPSNTV